MQGGGRLESEGHEQAGRSRVQRASQGSSGTGCRLTCPHETKAAGPSKGFLTEWREGRKGQVSGDRGLPSLLECAGCLGVKEAHPTPCPPPPQPDHVEKVTRNTATQGSTGDTLRAWEPVQ